MAKRSTSTGTSSARGGKTPKTAGGMGIGVVRTSSTGGITIGGGTIGTGTGVTIPTGIDPDDPVVPPKNPYDPNVPSVGDPVVGGTRPPIGIGSPVGPSDYTGNIGQFGSYGPSTTNVFGAPGADATKIIYRDIMVNSGIPPIVTGQAQVGSTADQMQKLAGSQSDQARQEVLRRMSVNTSGNSTFDPRKPQTGSIFGTAFSKAGDSKSPF